MARLSGYLQTYSAIRSISILSINEFTFHGSLKGFQSCIPAKHALPSILSCPVQSFTTASRDKGYYKTRKKKEKANPFVQLNIIRPGQDDTNIPYAAVKSKFLQIAMQHHPDVATEDEEISREIFIKARKAFEQLAEGDDGIAILRSDESPLDNADWFKAETGYDMPYMDAATIQEVARMTEEVGGGDGGGLDRDGGMWTLARMVTRSVKAGGDGKEVLQLETGTVRDRAIDGVLRRRRRRR